MKKTYTQISRIPVLNLCLPFLMVLLILGLNPAVAQQCTPLSTLPCSEIKASLPVNFNFDGNEAGLADKTGVKTGFTMVDKPSVPLVTPTNSTVPGYEPSLLQVTSGHLKITTTAGLAFKNPSQSANTNSQVNALGVGVDAKQKLTIETTLVQPSAGTGKYEQAGLWFGLDEDNYVKLDVVSAGSGRSNIEMVKEVGALINNTDAVKTAAMTLSSSTVTLKFILDNSSKTLQGLYSVNGGAEISVGTFSIPDSFIAGKSLGSNNTSSFAGIFSSHRNSTTPIVFSFDNFKVSGEQIENPTPTPPTEFTEITWSTVAPQKFPVNEAQGKVVNGKLYTFGGFDSQKSIFVPTKRAFVYDPTSNIWTQIADLPHTPNGTDFGGVTHAGITTDGKDIFIAGGYTSNTSGTGQIFGTKQVWRYNVATNTYTRLPDLPIDISAGQLEFVNGKLHHIGGSNLSRTQDLGNHYVLDLSNTAAGWTTLSALPTPRHHAGTAVFENKIYFIGGQHGHDGSLTTSKMVHAYTPSTNSWSQVADLPVPSGTSGRGHISSSVVVIGKRVLVLGGETVHNSGRTNMVSAYSPATNSWENLTPLPQSRFSGVAGILSGNIFYTGGSNTSTTYKGVPKTSTVQPVTKALSFNPSSLSYSVVQEGTTPGKSSVLSANEGTPAVTLTKSVNSNWLILPASSLGTLSFNIDAKGLAPGKYQSTITASANGYSSASLQVSLEVTATTVSQSIMFSQASQSIEVVQGKSQNLLEYISTSDNKVISASLTAADESGNVPAWVTVNGKVLNGISYTTGSEITFNLNAANLAVGTYAATISASAAGYTSGILDIKLTVKSATSGTLTNVKINFQDEPTVPPTGWLRDYGQALGARTSTNQGSGFTYGWKKRSDNLPVDFTANGRNRNSPADILLATLMHMNGSDINGNAVEGIWELKVANGNYDVTVTAGDGLYLDSKHVLNVEGASAIQNFIPTSSVKFKTATVTVSVADGFLTIDGIGGVNTKINSIIVQPTQSNRPSVVAINPEDGSKNVSTNTSVSTSILKLPNGGINNATITSSTVYLTEESTGTRVPSNVNGTGGGDAITLVPGSTLKVNTIYRFTITDGVKDLSGVSFIPYSSTFTTGAAANNETINVSFDKVALANTKGRHSSLTVGPDGKLYATTIDGIIKRFTINADGTLGTPETIYSLQDASGTRQQRLLIGFAFDPASTATNLIAWVSHSTYAFLNGPEWDGKLTKLSGNNLQNVQDVVINLPRSTKDHLTNSIVFGPDNALYFTQGSISAMGREDNTWGLRPERLLSAAVLRLDASKITTLPLNAKTSEGGGTYNPYATNAPLTIYASGTRNAYDLVWHSNGKLYVPTNGSAAGGNTPASVTGTLRTDGTTYNGPSVPALTNVQQTQKDFLFRVEKGGYYGHPNPLRGEYVMNGGNPTSAIDPAQVDAYPLGTAPDKNWRGYSFDFENNKSPNGIIEYKSNAFNGILKGKLLVVRYSQNDDIICLTPGGPELDIVSSVEGTSIPGFSGFVDPLDITEDVKTGNIYVSEYGGEGQITLLKAKSTTVTEPNPTTIALKPIADSFTRNGNFSDTNYGTETSVTVKGGTSTGFTRVAYFKFSLASISSASSAKLRVYGSNVQDNISVNIAAFGVNDDSWTETGITWRNAPAASTSALNSVIVNNTAKYYEIDLTEFVKSQLSGDKIVSIRIANPENHDKTVNFNSRENAANTPELVISTNTETSNGLIAVSPLKIYDNDVSGGEAGIKRLVTIKNNGTGSLSISEIGISGLNSNQFILEGATAGSIAAGGTKTFNVSFNPTTTGLKTATVVIKSNDTKNPTVSVPVRGLGTTGVGGTNEPSLQAILNLMEIPVNAGDDDASTSVIHSSTTSQKAALLGEEVSIQKFVKAGTGNVTIEPLAVFGPSETNPVVGMGWYLSGDVNSKKELFTVSNIPATNSQTVNVNFSGITTFDPAGSSFGLYSRWPFFNNRHVYSEDNLNSFTGSIPHHVRVYPYKNASGIVPNAYVIAIEEHTSGFDFQDLVFVVKNVKPAPTVTEPSLVTLSPIADSYINDGSKSGINYGSEINLIVKGGTSAGFTRKTYLKFSLAGISSATSAKLRVYGGNVQDNTIINVSSLGATDDSWTESGITWSTAPSASTASLTTTAVGSVAKYYEFDVTSFVKSQVAGDKIVTLILENSTNQDRTISFNSKENTANKPELIIDTTGGGTNPDPSDPNTGIFVENLDNFPSNDDLVFSRIQIPWSRDGVVYNANHDEVTIRIQNKGTSTLKISDFNISNTAFWNIIKLSGATYSSTSLPLSIEAGKSADLTLKFIAKDQNTRVKILRETLTIVSNDSKAPNKIIRLNGLWQYRGEGNNEPYAQEIIDVFNFKTKTGFSRNDPDKGDPTKLKGDEILSFYFVKADPTKPVYIRQLAAYHGCCNSTERIMWHNKGTTTLNTIFTHVALDGQNLLPRKSTSTNAPADGTINPTGAFGFRVGSVDWSDATRTPSNLIGIRVWKAIDMNGRVIKDTYLIANDYLGSDATNYDYNDNLYYVTNMKPEVEQVALRSTPSAVDFSERLTGSSTTLSLNVKNFGIVYADGSKDATIQINSVEIVGENKAEFSTTLPLKTTLTPQESVNFSVNFKPVSQGLKIADVLIYHSGSPSPLRVPLYGIAKNQNVSVTVHHRINSGSPTSVTVGGKTWAADNLYAFDNLEPYKNPFLSQIAATDEDVIYLTEQSSNADTRPFRYEIPVANGNYVVRLHFAEIYWGAIGFGSNGGAGSRVMSVNLEGQTLISNLDVVKEVGKTTAVVKNIPVTVSDGKLNINFTASVNRPMVCAVEVYSFSSSTTSASFATTSMIKEGSIEEELEVNQKIKVYPNPVAEKFTIDFPVNYEGKTAIYLIDQYGKSIELEQLVLEKGGSKLDIDISSLSLRAGMYILRLQSDHGKTDNIKLIIR